MSFVAKPLASVPCSRFNFDFGTLSHILHASPDTQQGSQDTIWSPLEPGILLASVGHRVGGAVGICQAWSGLRGRLGALVVFEHGRKNRMLVKDCFFAIYVRSFQTPLHSLASRPRIRAFGTAAGVQVAVETRQAIALDAVVGRLAARPRNGRGMRSRSRAEAWARTVKGALSGREGAMGCGRGGSQPLYVRHCRGSRTGCATEKCPSHLSLFWFAKHPEAFSARECTSRGWRRRSGRHHTGRCL
mmetsp:Transcript_46765/g.100113  ORF Transcript_46765/g.100113 Transcript_46765/m.100113 type:complete len:245 (+) Transcript_46765:764-1498(+)